MSISAIAAIIMNQGRMDNLLSANRFLKERIKQVTCAEFENRLSMRTLSVWPEFRDPYDHLDILDHDHIHLFSDPVIRRILAKRKRVYDFDSDITIICQEYSRDYE